MIWFWLEAGGVRDDGLHGFISDLLPSYVFFLFLFFARATGVIGDIMPVRCMSESAINISPGGGIIKEAISRDRFSSPEEIWMR